MTRGILLCGDTSRRLGLGGSDVNNYLLDRSIHFSVVFKKLNRAVEPYLTTLPSYSFITVALRLRIRLVTLVYAANWLTSSATSLGDSP
jgi:hypothetical protein